MTTLFSLTPADQVTAQIQLEQLRVPAGKIPTPLTEALESFLAQLTSGKAMQGVTLEPEIGTQQAAELLQVSRPYLVKLIEQGALPHRKVGPSGLLHVLRGLGGEPGRASRCQTRPATRFPSMPQRLCIALTAEERQHLLKFTTTGTAKVRAVTRARILLLADTSEGQRLSAKDIATSLECSQSRVARVCHRFDQQDKILFWSSDILARPPLLGASLSSGAGATPARRAFP
ncbi:helix-turn-helix domain-containing protein [Deinococcus sp. Arct2-2]|nr:helix-turn-helix domain-containing protein [Deinococcus sp. Arct2-2]